MNSVRRYCALALLCLGLTVAMAPPAWADNPDPWESMNRGIFWFNEKVDIYALGPAARGWQIVTPSIFRTAVTNFNNNLQMPVSFVNDVLQLKPRDAGFDVLRLAYNTTLGLAGIIDIATMVDIPQNDAEFGETLGYWGCPPGPYFVVPFFGPSNVRDAVGRVGDFSTTLYFSLLPYWSTLLIRGVELVNIRSSYLEEIDENRREAFDYYVFMRNAYLQNRRAKISRARGEDDGLGPADDDLYYFEDEELLDEESAEAPGHSTNDGKGDRTDEPSAD